MSLGHKIPPIEYIQLLALEIQSRAPFIRRRLRAPKITSIYFGGGTPSLLEPTALGEILARLRDLEICVAADAEVTIEINPETINEGKLDHYLHLGVNRFSVGAQTFDERLLNRTRRTHTPNDTKTCLSWLRARQLNFSLDLLFGLPEQSLAQLQMDLDALGEFDPPHLSTYCLTVPPRHPLAQARASDEEQLAMFAAIESGLGARGLKRYEISNFARPGFESQHNKIYWQGEPYWGLGQSGHSYLPIAPWGLRWHNANALEAYANQVRAPSRGGEWTPEQLPAHQLELLELHQALTDFVYTRLRQLQGVSLAELQRSFPPAASSWLERKMGELCSADLLSQTPTGYRLSARGLDISDSVFVELAALKSDLSGVDKPEFASILGDERLSPTNALTMGG